VGAEVVTGDKPKGQAQATKPVQVIMEEEDRFVIVMPKKEVKKAKRERSLPPKDREADTPTVVSKGNKRANTTSRGGSSPSLASAPTSGTDAKGSTPKKSSTGRALRGR